MKDFFEKIGQWFRLLPGVAWDWLKSNWKNWASTYVFVFAYLMGAILTKVDVGFIPSMLIIAAGMTGAYYVVKLCNRS